jgi:hypothetical protein
MHDAIIGDTAYMCGGSSSSSRPLGHRSAGTRSWVADVVVRMWATRPKTGHYPSYNSDIGFSIDSQSQRKLFMTMKDLQQSWIGHELLVFLADVSTSTGVRTARMWHLMDLSVKLE